MEIKKYPTHLSVTSNIYFHERNYFCGRTYIYLVAHKDPCFGWKENSIGISLHDGDDYDVGLIYHP